MIIGVDGNEANVQKRVGVSLYALNLLKYFKKKANREVRFKIYLKSQASHDLPSPNNYFEYDIVPGKILWSQIFLPVKLLSDKKIDVFFHRHITLPAFVLCQQLSLSMTYRIFIFRRIF